MRIVSGTALGVAAALFVVGCGGSSTTTDVTALANPDSLTYTLLAGAPGSSSGVLLEWTAALDSRVVAYDVYARNATTAAWDALAETVLTSFYDQEEPSLQYYVASQDQYGDVSSGTAPLTVDTLQQLAPPVITDSATAAFDSAVVLTWSVVPSTDSATFSYYSVYSEAPTSGACASGYTLTNLYLEGTTASPAFAINGLANGTPVCYAVTTVTVSGQQSLLSPWVLVTPDSSAATLAQDISFRGKIVRHGTGRRVQIALLSQATRPAVRR